MARLQLQQQWGEPSELPTSVQAARDSFCASLKETATDRLGCEVDWSGSFRTNDDALYRSFVHWQLRVLKDQGRIARCKRTTLYSLEQAAPSPKRFTDQFNSLLGYFAVRQEIVCDHDPSLLPPQLRDLRRPEVAERMYVVSLCRTSMLSHINHQTRCVVSPDVDLAVFLVLGRYKPVNRDDIERNEPPTHDGDQWLAICSEEVALHMAHQHFIIAQEPASEDVAVPTETRSGADRQSRPRGQRALMKLARLKGRDLADVQVKCSIEGQPHPTVPIALKESSRGRNRATWLLHILADSEATDGESIWKENAEIQKLVVTGRWPALANPYVFTYFQFEDHILSLDGGKCVVAFRDGYYFPLSGSAGSEWKGQVCQVIQSLEQKGYLGQTARTLLNDLDAKEEWHITTPNGTGVPVPWAPELVVGPTCEQALMHAFLTVSSLLRAGADVIGEMTDEDWDRVFQPNGRSTAPPVFGHDPRSDVLAAARKEFLSWYPMHLLVVPQARHLPFVESLLSTLLCHVAVWGPSMCPKRVMVCSSKSAYKMTYRPVYSPPDGLPLSTYGASVARLYLAQRKAYDRWSEQKEGIVSLDALSKISSRMREFYRCRSEMRPDNAGVCAMLLWAHLRDPGSAFAKLPLELVAHIMAILRSGRGCDSAGLMLMDRQFENDLDLSFQAIAAALHSQCPENAIQVVLAMPQHMRRYCKHLTLPDLSLKLIRRYHKIIACGLLPVCPGFSTLMWRSWIARKRRAPTDNDELLDSHDYHDAAAAAREMIHWWSKYVTPIDSEDGPQASLTAWPKQIKRAPQAAFGVVNVLATCRMTRQLSFVLRLMGRIADARQRFSAPDNSVVVHIRVCEGQPEWAQRILDIMTSHFYDDPETDGDHPTQARRRGFSCGDIKQEVRRAVVQDPVLRPHTKGLITITSYFQERMMEDGLAGVSVPFNEEACIRRFAHHIAQRGRVRSVQIESSVHGSTIGQLAAMPPKAALFVPGLPHVWLTIHSNTDNNTKSDPTS